MARPKGIPSHKKLPREVRICKNKLCSGEFIIRTDLDTQYCGLPCYWSDPNKDRHQSKETIEKRVSKNKGQRRAWVTKICTRCGTEFKVRKCHSAKTHCSKYCADTDPQKVKKQTIARKKTLLEHPEIMIKLGKKVSRALKGKAKTKEHILNAMRGSLKSVCQRPNKFEFHCIEYLNRVYPNKFIYTGNGSFIVNNRSADAYSKELSTVALFNGVYWHLKHLGLEYTEENKRLREKIEAAPFLQASYKVIFIWEDELNQMLKSKNFSINVCKIYNTIK